MGEARLKGSFEERRDEAIKRNPINVIKGRIARVKFSPAVFVHFFEQHDRAFQCHKGLPDGSDLVTILQPMGRGSEADWIAVFRHDSFKEVDSLNEAPFLSVEYMAYQLKDEEKPADEVAVADKPH